MIPASTGPELVRAGILDAAGAAVWSLWDGYLIAPSGHHLRSLLDQHGIALQSIHTSGHASVRDLRRLVDSIRPGRVVPVHSEAAGRFVELFANVECHTDGEWWPV